RTGRCPTPPTGTSRSPGRGARTSQRGPAIHVVQSERGNRAGAGPGAHSTRKPPNSALPFSRLATIGVAAPDEPRYTRSRSNATSATQPAPSDKRRPDGRPARANRRRARRVPGTTVGGIVVECEAALRDVHCELGAAEREQRPHDAAAPARRHAGEPGRPAPLEHAQQDRLHLIVRVMRGDEVARGVAALHEGEPGVARAPRRRLGRAGAELELAELERQTGPPRQFT